MNWLSKIVINELEMIIKDSVARPKAESAYNDLHDYIWDGRNPNVSSIFYVSTNGSDDNTGQSSEEAFRTINHAVQVAMYPIAAHRASATIIVEEGTYDESVIIGATNNNLKINIFLNGNVTVNGGIGVINTKCWIFGVEGTEVLTIIGTANTSVIGTKLPMFVRESGELYNNVETRILETESNVPSAIKIENCSVYANPQTTLINGTYTKCGIDVVRSTLRARIDASNITANCTFYAVDSIVQSIGTPHDQTIDGYENLYTGSRLSPVT